MARKKRPSRNNHYKNNKPTQKKKVNIKVLTEEEAKARNEETLKGQGIGLIDIPQYISSEVLRHTQELEKYNELVQAANDYEQKAVEARKMAEKLKVQKSAAISALYGSLLAQEDAVGKKYTIQGDKMLVEL